MAELSPIIESLDEVAPRYAAILCDVWGVIHNGVRAFQPATAALTRVREKGLAVVLVTNAPRPNRDVIAQLRVLGVPDTAWDAVVTSGDVTRDLIAEGPRRIYHLGPDRDVTIYDGLDVDLVDEFEALGSSVPASSTTKPKRRRITRPACAASAPATCPSSAPIPTSSWSEATA